MRKRLTKEERLYMINAVVIVHIADVKYHLKDSIQIMFYACGILNIWMKALIQ